MGAVDCLSKKEAEMFGFFAKTEVVDLLKSLINNEREIDLSRGFPIKVEPDIVNPNCLVHDWSSNLKVIVKCKKASNLKEEVSKT